VIVRYGQLFRGLKVRIAQEHGAVGVVIYSDPADDGFTRGPVFPEGPWRPPFSVQRGSAQFLSICPGDPRTEECGGNVTDHVPSVPVQPIGYGDAYHFQGGLNFTYTIGGGSTENTVSLQVQSNWTTTPIWNVCVDINGTEAESTKQYILLGNHRDAWTFGGTDPNSGSSVILEVVRAFGELTQSGWKPQRSIKVCSWDGEEYGLLGSTAHAMANKADLSANCLAYLNTDVAVAGTSLSASATPSLVSLLASALAKVQDPASGKPLSEVFNARPFPQGSFMPLGSGSDYTSYIHHLGIPSLDWGFVSDFSGAPYHSAFDDLTWETKFGSFNGTYEYFVTLAQMIGTVAIELSSSDKVPSLDMNLTSVSLSSYLQLFQELVANSTLDISTAPLQSSIEAFAAVVEKDAYSPEQTLFLERSFLSEEGLPLRPFYRHLIQAPGLNTGYQPLTFPGPSQAVMDKQPVAAKQEIANLITVIDAATAALNAGRHASDATKMKIL